MANKAISSYNEINQTVKRWLEKNSDKFKLVPIKERKPNLVSIKDKNDKTGLVSIKERKPNLVSIKDKNDKTGLVSIENRDDKSNKPKTRGR